MSIQTLRGSSVHGKLGLSWILMSDSVKGVAIQVARDSEFTEDLHVYILPPVTQCFLDVGKGEWFFRAGACEKWKIEWTGIAAPVYIDTPKDSEKVSKSFFKIIHTRSITNGIRIHTDSSVSSYAILEYSKDPRFLATTTKTVWFEDPGRGYFDCLGLDPLHTYHIRITSTQTPFALFPKDSVHVLQEWQILQNKKALPPTKPLSLRDQAERKRSAILLKEANESKKPIRFSSGQDYTQFLAAKAANQGALE